MKGREDAMGEAGLLAELAGALLSWYDACARDLPWRRHPSPYQVWVSEIMLQQTRVEAVKPYYDRFLKALPDIAALAACPEEQLLKLWEGLGYYSRVRNMQRAARQICREYDGRFPQQHEQILALPGIGPYTAGAVASIAFGQPTPAIDGNVMRVISRLLGSRLEIGSREAKALVAETVAGCMPPERPGTFNQALMELGAVVCIPNGAAQCDKCPVRGWCRACAEQSTDQIPVRAPKKGRRREERTVLVIRDGLLALLHKRPSTGLLAGLYELPALPGRQEDGAVIEAVRRMGIEPVQVRALPTAKHIFTHIEWDMTGYMVLAEDLSGFAAQGELFAAPLRQIREELAIPSAFSAYMPYLKQNAEWDEQERSYLAGDGGDDL